MPTTFKIFTEKMGGTNPSTHKGKDGEIIWNPDDGQLRLCDGNTPGGTAISGSGGGGLASRNTTATVTASSVADAARSEIDVTGHKGYNLYSITADKACWVRLYDSAASRTADASRAQGTDPSPNAGVIAEAVFTGNGGTVNFTPGVVGYNNESTPTTTVPVAVVNNHGSTQNIGVSLTVLRTEA